MNEENLDFLKNQVKFMGFGETLHNELESKIAQQPKEFSLTTQNEFKKGEEKEKVDYRLDFRKSDSTDMFFFNRYHATLKNEDPAKEKSQTFYVDKSKAFTAKEAFNLLSGRAVNKKLLNKEKEPYNAWVQLDFSAPKDKHENYKSNQFHAGYGYDLEVVLAKYPIKELSNNEDKLRIMASLEKGNLHGVTFVKGDKEEKMYIEANPQFKTLNLYDSHLQSISRTAEKKEDREQGKDKKEDQKQEADEDGAKKRKTGKKRGAHV